MLSEDAVRAIEDLLTGKARIDVTPTMHYAAGPLGGIGPAAVAAAWSIRIVRDPPPPPTEGHDA